MKKITEMMKLIAEIVSILLIVTIVVFALCYISPCMLRTEYTTKISVDKPYKIESAISNVVADLEKRDFVPVNLVVNWHLASKTYVIYARGIDRTYLSKYEP